MHLRNKLAMLTLRMGRHQLRLLCAVLARLLPCLAFLVMAAIYLVGCVASPLPAVETTAPRPVEPTLDDYWDGKAEFFVEIADTGLPMGESDTIVLADGTWRSYVHASHHSLGVVDQCGAPVEFPGCLVNFTSHDNGRSFRPTSGARGSPMCQIACTRCPCDSQRDHIDQQQYPRVTRLFTDDARASWIMTYEYRANTFVRRSADGLNWSAPQEVPLTGIWREWLMQCAPDTAIGAHPFAPATYDCLVGSPPGLFIDTAATPPELYLFVGLGQNPSGMGCYRAPLHAPPSLLRACDHNPLFIGAQEYGALDVVDATANAFYDFRTISSADLLTVGNRHYLFFEGVRGPGPGDAGDTQFLLGLARSMDVELDGEWELFPNNPILLDLPGNVGVGHADVVVANSTTFLYTSLDGVTRSRLRLDWK